MSVVTDDDIQDAVAYFILESAAEDECLYEVIGDLFTGEWSEAVEEQMIRPAIEQAYELFQRARVSVVINEVEYNA